MLTTRLKVVGVRNAIGAASVSSDELVEVKAPISGIFYRAPSPGAPHFVEIGAAVKKGQVLGLLEAMKLFSKIKAPADGVVREIVGVNAEAVGTGQTLFVLERRIAA